MENEAEINQLEKENSTEINFYTSTVSPSDEHPDELEKENESDGLDPLFWEANQVTAKRVLEFDSSGGGSSEDDADFEVEGDHNNDNKKQEKKRKTSVDLHEFIEKKKRTKSVHGKTQKTSKEKSANSNRNEMKLRKAQHVDFQRVMRERKDVGFKCTPMVEKSISSVLEKIRQRKIEVSKQLMRSKKINLDDHSEEDELITDILNSRQQKAVETSINSTPLITTIEDKSRSIDEKTTNIMPLADETTQSFRAPINDTQDLFVDSEFSKSQDDDLNKSGSPALDVSPSVPSLNLQLDSAFADEISSSDEESDKENVEPYPKHTYKGSSTEHGDPVKNFLDEEALEDDSDDDLFQEKDEEDISDSEEICDYIATNVVEKQVDLERNNLYHQQWQQQQDEAGTEKILQKLNGGTKQRKASYLDDEEADRTESDEDESDRDVDAHADDTNNDVSSGEDEEGYIASGVTTKKLKQMIPLMFTDKDDVYVSSEDEETERSLSKKLKIKKRGLEQKSKFSSTSEETSREVFSRIKKLNVIPETKKGKTSSIFDAVLSNGSSSHSSKSFLRRASSHPGPPSHRQGSSTGRSYIFGRDDSNSRSSMSLVEDSSNLGQKESQVKKTSSAKFTGSQTKWSTQHTDEEGEIPNGGMSLFDILKRSSMQTSYESYDTPDSMAIDHQTLFAAFKSVKKYRKIEGRSF